MKTSRVVIAGMWIGVTVRAMNIARAFGVLALGAIACGGGPAPVTAKHEATSRYRKGDFVVYRYSGLYSKEPVELRESIAAQDGKRLTIDVVATRGSEKRRWQQVVTDSPDNERNNVVDELYEYAGGERRKLDNAGNADLKRLYEWTVIVPDGKPEDVHTDRAMLEVGHDNFTCNHTTGKTKWHGRSLAFETFDCPEFLWTHGRVRYWDPATGDEILRADVAGMGNDE